MTLAVGGILNTNKQTNLFVLSKLAGGTIRSWKCPTIPTFDSKMSFMRWISRKFSSLPQVL